LKNKFYLLVFSLCFLCVYANSTIALTADTNIALNKAVIGTFSETESVTDGIASHITSATSKNVSSLPQFLTIDLGAPAYIGSIKIFWDKDAYSNNYDIKVSSDSKSWFTELAKADAGTGVIDQKTGTISQTITGKRFGSLNRYVQIYIPIGSKATKNSVKITEIQVFPATEQKIAIEDVNAYVVTNNKAIITIKTNIGTAKASILYGKSPDLLDQTATIHELGEITSATLYNLETDQPYYYQAKVWDIYENAAVSRVKYFGSGKKNIALNKKVQGTFTELPPQDPYVNRTKDVLSRVNDGGTSYFTAMATSNSVEDGDQYAIIDLGKKYSVDSVVTYWRNLAFPQEFSVTISNDNKTFSDGTEKLNAEKGAFSRSDAGDPMRVIKADLKGAATRFIKVLVNKNSPCFQKHANWNFVQLMEVEVYPK